MRIDGVPMPSFVPGKVERVAFGTVREEFADAHIHDVGLAEWIAWTPMLVLILVLGIYPNIIFHVTDPTVTRLTQLIGH